MNNTLSKTNDEFVRAVLHKVESMTCYMRSKNLSNMLTRSNVEVYTKDMSESKTAVMTKSFLS